MGLRAAAMLLLLVTASCAPRLLEPGPHSDQPMDPKFTETALIASDGYELPLRRWLPADGEPEAVVVALHGFNDYSNAFADLGAWLAAQSVALYAYDQRGFGATRSAGMWAGAERMVADLRMALSQARIRHPQARLFALGDSMGGAVILAAAGEEPLDVDGVMMVGPAVRGRAMIPLYQEVALWVSAHTMPWLRVSGQGLDITPSDNLAMLQALGRDPLVIKETRIDAIWGVVDLMDRALAAAPSLNGRSLLLYGARDEIIPPNATLALLDRLPPASNGQRKIAIYENGYHMLLRDLRAEVAWQDIVAWMRDPGADLPSGADRVDPRVMLRR